MPLAKYNKHAIYRDSSLNWTGVHPPLLSQEFQTIPCLSIVYLPRRAENFGVKSLYRDISTVDMGGGGVSKNV